MPPKMSTYDGIPAISPEQFDKLVELLTPGYELSMMMLSQYKANEAAKVEYQSKPEPVVVEPVEATKEPADQTS